MYKEISPSPCSQCIIAKIRIREKQEQEKSEMKQQLPRYKEKEMIETNNKLSLLMNYLGFVASSFHPPQANNEIDHSNEDGVDESDENIGKNISSDFDLDNFFLLIGMKFRFFLLTLDQ